MATTSVEQCAADGCTCQRYREAESNFCTCGHAHDAHIEAHDADDVELGTVGTWLIAAYAAAAPIVVGFTIASEPTSGCEGVGAGVLIWMVIAAMLVFVAYLVLTLGWAFVRFLLPGGACRYSAMLPPFATGGGLGLAVGALIAFNGGC